MMHIRSSWLREMITFDMQRYRTEIVRGNIILRNKTDVFLGITVLNNCFQNQIWTFMFLKKILVDISNITEFRKNI